MRCNSLSLKEHAVEYSDGCPECSIAGSRPSVNENICREEPPRGRVLAAFLYYAGLLYRKVEPFIVASYGAVHQWYPPAELSESDRCRQSVVTVDLMNVSVGGDELCVWTAIDGETFEAIRGGVGRSRPPDVLLFLMLCRGQPLITVERGSWYEWPREKLL